MSYFRKVQDLGTKFKDEADKLQKSLKDDPYQVPRISTEDRVYVYGYSGWSGISSSSPYREEPRMIFCSYCDSANYPYQTRCSSCGAPFTRADYAESNPLQALQEMVDEGYKLLDFLQKRREKYICDEKLKESIMGMENADY